ncbi:MAG: efflux RND transporter periplasmic adaptor subunit, partial [Cyanobacteria bacterium P01_D01_bin.44]
IEASGRVEPITTVNISPEITGRLVALQADQGDTVQAGQVLAQMLDAELRAQLAQAQAQLAEAEAEYDEIRSGNRPEEISRAQAQVDSAQAQFNLSTKRLERHQFLAQEGAIAQLDLDEIINEEQTARANLREAQQSLQELNNGARPKAIAQTAARVTAARAQIEVIQAQLDATVIRAPFDGIITQKYATVGAIVTPTTSASATASATSSSIFALASGLELLVDVPEANISQIEVGQPVEIVVDSYPDQTFEGRVRLISPEAVVEDNVTSFQVRIELLTGQSELRSGMNGDAIFIGESIADALMVPTVAITNQGQDIGVLVADEQGEARFQAISVGITQEGQTHVVSGLESGEKVFVDFPEGKVPGPTGGPL